MFSWRAIRRRALIVGHRGASKDAPENTMAAFRAAVRAGVQAVELDVHLTADGKVVVIHDESLLRTAGLKKNISDLNYRDLRTLDVGRWFGKQFEGEHIPLLSEVLDALPRSVGINVEVKRSARRRSGDDVVRRCAEVIREAGAAERVLLSSFHIPYLRRAMKEIPETPRGLLYHTLLHAGRDPFTIMTRLEASYLILFHRTLRRRLVLDAARQGFYVGEYTIDTPARLSRSLRFGVNAIITNDPARIVRLTASL